MLTINKDITYADCEKMLNGIVSRKSDFEELRLPSKVQFSRMGGAATLLQLIITWARHFEDTGTLVSYANPSKASENVDAVIRRFVSSPYGLCALKMTQNIVYQDRKTSSLAEHDAAADEYLKRIHSGDLESIRHGPGAFLICADETPFAHIRSFYRSGDDVSNKLKEEEDFSALAENLLMLGIDTKQKAKHFSSDDFSDVGGLLRELILNTHDHATSDLNNVLYSKSVRGSFTAKHQIKRSEIPELSNGLRSLETYLEKRYAPQSGGKMLEAIEISVFDSGPGLAARYLGSPMDNSISLEQEYDIVRECFLKHRSSKTYSEAGVGLHRTISMLKRRGGFLRIRTGRLSLYRAFSSPDTSPLLDDEIYLLDASSCGGALTALAPVAGALVTVLLPLEK